MKLDVQGGRVGAAVDYRDDSSCGTVEVVEGGGDMNTQVRRMGWRLVCCCCLCLALDGLGMILSLQTP